MNSKRHSTVAVALEQFCDKAPWNYMMALAIIYSLPPVALFSGLIRHVAPRLSSFRL